MPQAPLTYMYMEILRYFKLRGRFFSEGYSGNRPCRIACRVAALSTVSAKSDGQTGKEEPGRPSFRDRRSEATTLVRAFGGGAERSLSRALSRYAWCPKAPKGLAVRATQRCRYFSPPVARRAREDFPPARTHLPAPTQCPSLYRRRRGRPSPPSAQKKTVGRITNSADRRVLRLRPLASERPYNLPSGACAAAEHPEHQRPTDSSSPAPGQPCS